MSKNKMPKNGKFMAKKGNIVIKPEQVDIAPASKSKDKDGKDLIIKKKKKDR